MAKETLNEYRSNITMIGIMLNHTKNVQNIIGTNII